MDKITKGSETLSLSILHNSISNIYNVDNILSWNNLTLSTHLRVINESNVTLILLNNTLKRNTLKRIYHQHYSLYYD